MSVRIISEFCVSPIDTESGRNLLQTTITYNFFVAKAVSASHKPLGPQSSRTSRQASVHHGIASAQHCPAPYYV